MMRLGIVIDYNKEKYMNNEKIVFLDMDGVCCDFVGGVGKLFDFSDVHSMIKYGNWEFYNDIGISEADMWDAIRAEGERFWVELEELMSHKILYNNLSKIAKVIYLTTPNTRIPESWSGKLKWLYKRRGVSFRNIIMCKDKSLLAGPNRILIDDKKDNIHWFNYFGGHGVLFRQRWNIEPGCKDFVHSITLEAYSVIKQVERIFNIDGKGDRQMELDLFNKHEYT